MQPHHHSGRGLAHHHTSYGALAILLVLCGLVMTLINLSVPSAATADTASDTGGISIGGRVAGPPPALAPSITDPVSGHHFGQAHVEAKGSCVASMLVVIAGNGTDRGSAVCAEDGTYFLSFDLFAGPNDLVARQYDSLDQVSPSSSHVVTYFDSPSAVSSPGHSASTMPNASPVAAPLISADIRYVIAAGAAFRLVAHLQSGLPPYAVSVDWGDGKQGLSSRKLAGEVLFEHTYAEPRMYIVKLGAADSAGNNSYFQTVVYVGGAVTHVANATPYIGGTLVYWPILGLASIMVFTFWIGDLYGRRRLMRSVA